jgi:pimeloyl-ACP methyl ester carboxylesterase
MQPVLDRDGFPIHVDVVGDGPFVLLTHGFGASSHMFASTVEALAPDHRVVTWDLRGHGRSGHLDDPMLYSAALAVEDMVAVLDAAGAEQAVVLGHSLGGYLSLALHCTHPERVAALVLVGTGPGYRNDEGRAGWNRLADRYAKDLDERGLDGLPGSDELRADVHPTAVGLAHAARGILRQHDSSVLASLPTIAVPTLVVVGEHDKPFRNSSEYMAAKIPGAELVVIEGAGHGPPVSHPEEFNAVLRHFLAAR